jgi:uncharacterized protein (TIGR00369 family)
VSASLPSEPSPFLSHLGARRVDAGDDRAVVAVPFTPELANSNGLLHGGVLCTLADSAAGTAIAFGAESPPAAIATISLAIEFVAPVRAGGVTAHARVLRRGASLVPCEVDVVDDGGGLVAKVLVTYRVAGSPPP